MKKKFVSSMLIMLLVGTFGITLKIAPVAFGDQSGTSGRKEVWKLVNVTNPMTTYNTSADINVVVNTREGVNIACSTNITNYFENPGGYENWLDWLNGTNTLPHNWGEMDWSVSNGSLTSITYDEIQQWGDIYADSGGGVEYWTFMGNTYMADWNLTATYNDPDIISTSSWTGNNITIIDDLWVPADTRINIVFKIVITEPGAYYFNVTSPQGVVEISPSYWATGGVGSLVVGEGPAYEYNTIQDAIDNASSGDTITVAAGTYAGAMVYKDVTISGASGGASTVTSGVPYKDGSPLCTAFRLNASADGAEIRDFTINCNSSESFFFAVFSRNASDVIVDSLTANDAVQGITNWGGSNWEITNNVLNNTEAAGGGGIAIWLGAFPPSYPVCSGNLIKNNTITATATAPDYTCPGIGVGLDLRWGAYDDLTGNEDISSNQIINNNITAPGALNGVGIEIGVLGLEGNTTKIAAVLGVIHDNTIRDNTIDGADLGVYFYTVTDMRIKQNEIKNCNEGIHIADGISGNTINYNNIFGNAMGINNTAGELVDARFNWWGDDEGPGNETGSTGDYVTDNVDYGPWLIKPYAPGQVVPVSVVYVDPPFINRTGPALDTTFTIDVNVANVSMFYGFQFTLEWNSTLLNLTNYDVKLPPQWTMDYNVTIITPGNYSLAATALPPSPPFNGSTTLASLTFEIVYDPICPESVSCSLALENVTIVDSDGKPIIRLVYSGNYSCYSSKAKLVLTPQDPTAYKVPTEFYVNVNVTNVVNLHTFEFELTYDTDLLDWIETTTTSFDETNTENVTTGWSPGSMYVYVEGISPPVNGTEILATIYFKVKGFVWNTTRTSANCTLAFSLHKLWAPGDVPIEHDAVNGTYRYTPIPGDLKMDGTVDIFDIILAAVAFGSKSGDPSPPWNPVADLNCDGVIDILDIVRIAVNFGRNEP